jgi:Rad3-related DNA helicase
MTTKTKISDSQRTELADKMFAIANVLWECDYWINGEQTYNYLNKDSVLKRVVGFDPDQLEYISDFVDEAFAWSLKRDRYEVDIAGIVDFGHDGTYAARKLFQSDPEKAAQEFFPEPEAICDFLKETDNHDLDLNQVAEIFGEDFEDLAEDLE